MTAVGVDAISAQGLRVVPMSPAFASALDRFHERLSPETTRRRFFSHHPHLTPIEVERFTHVDHDQREALVVVGVDGEIVAVGRFDRLAPDSDTAEVAFVVDDDWQHRGIGGALFGRLAAAARTHGIERFVAETLGDNVAMLTVFRHGATVIGERFEGGVIDVTMDLGPSGRPH